MKPVKRGTLLEVILETFNVSGDSIQDVDGESDAEAEATLRILLVEDNKVNRILAKQRLAKLGHLVTLSSDGSEAVRRVREQRFDYLDGHPDARLDGFETTAQIRLTSARWAVARRSDDGTRDRGDRAASRR